MKRILLASILLVLATPIILSAQERGAFVGSLGFGLTAAQGDFADNVIGLSAGSGFGMEGEARYYLLGGFSLGGFVNYMRFSSSYPATEGRLSFNFSQIGGLAKMNFIRLSKGVFYLTGGGGIFTPNEHYYIPDNSIDRSGDESGYFGFGGFGFMSKTDRKTLYELEFRYNYARADYTFENIFTDVWDFIYVGAKVSFSSKGKEPPPRY